MGNGNHEKLLSGSIINGRLCNRATHRFRSIFGGTWLHGNIDGHGRDTIQHRFYIHDFLRRHLLYSLAGPLADHQSSLC